MPTVLLIPESTATGGYKYTKQGVTKYLVQKEKKLSCGPVFSVVRWVGQGFKPRKREVGLRPPLSFNCSHPCSRIHQGFFN